MLHLAQVHQKNYSKSGLRLLATQKAENAWTVAHEEEFVLSTRANDYSENSLVLVELSSTQQILNIREAKDWVLELVATYLVNGITPAYLHQETERAEQWRQSLTLQSQELDRRTLELEARREQIQSLEEDLKREKKQLELHASAFEARNQELDRRALELESRSQQFQAREDDLEHRKPL